MTKPPRPSLFLYYWTFFISVCLIVGCYTQKKAEKQQAKVILEHRTVAARAFLKEFPNRVLTDTIFTTGFDSSEYIKARDEAIAYSKNTSTLSKKTIDSLRNKISSMSGGAKAVCADILLINDWLIDDNEKMNKTIVRLMSLPPKIEYRDRKITENDSTLYFVALMERDEYKEKYAIDHDWRVIREKKDKGNILIRIPRWLLIALLLAGAGYVFLGLKNKNFNLVKLATKTIGYVARKKKESKQDKNLS